MEHDWPSFDELRRLAEQSPDKLEAFRQREIDSLIEKAPASARGRLKGLQFQVNCQREIHKTPLASCIAISAMMHESLNRLNAVLNGKPYQQTNAEVGGVIAPDNVVPFAAS